MAKEKKNAKKASASEAMDEGGGTGSKTAGKPKISDLQAEAIFSARENVRHWENVVGGTKDQLKEEKNRLEAAQTDLGNLIDVAAGVVRPEDVEGPLFNGQADGDDASDGEEES